MNSERFTKKFLSDYGSNNGWCQELKLLFETLDMKGIFENLHLCDINLAMVKLRGNFETKWRMDVNNKPKLRTYKTFKTSFETSEYMKWNSEKSDRSLLAQFMCGILQLRVESGRFINLKLNERICQLCDLNCLEDEFHFLCICPVYSDLRKDLYLNYSQLLKNFDRVTEGDIFISVLKNPTKHLLKYIKCYWKVRKEKLYK